MPIKIPEGKSLDEIWEFALLEMKRESDDPNLVNEWVEFFVEKVRERCEKSKLKKWKQVLEELSSIKEFHKT